MSSKISVNGANLKKVVKEKLKLMKTRADKGQRPAYGLKDVLYKEDAKGQFDRDKKVLKEVQKAINQPQDLKKKKYKRKSPKIKGKSILDVVNTVNTVKKENKRFVDLHGDYNKAAIKNVKKYHNNTYKEGE